jgi:zinc protease
MVQAMFADHPYHYPIIGFKQDLWSLDRDVLYNFYKKHYVPNNATLVVVGDVDPEDVFKQVEELFGPIPKDETYKKEEFYHAHDLASVDLTIHRDIQQPIGLVSMILPGDKEKQRYTLDVVTTVLGKGRSSRLYKKLVNDLQLVADVAFFVHRFEDASVGFIYFQPLKIEDIGTITQIIKSELSDLAHNGPTKKELERAMRSVRVKMVSALESNHGQASAIGDAFVKTGDAQFAFNYANLTEEELEKNVKAFAQRYFTQAILHTGKAIPLSEHDKPFWNELQTISDEEDARILDGRVRTLALEEDRYALTVEPQQPKDFHFYKPLKYSLANGIKVFECNNQKLPKIDIVLSLKTKKYFDPEDKQGLYSFMCSMMVEGTKKYPGHLFAQTMEEYGITFQMEPGFIVMSMLKEDFHTGLELLSEILQHVTFDEEEVEKVREHMLSDLTMFWETPSDFAGLLLREKIYEGHPYSKNTEGTFEGIKNITQEDIVDFYHSHIVPEGARLSIVGDLSGYDIKKDLTHYLGSWKGHLTAELPCPQVKELTPATVKYPINRDQVVLLFGAHSIRRTNPDFDALLLFDQIFGSGGSMNSKLFSLREKTGLFYTIYGSLIAGSDEEPGMVVVKTIVSLDKLEEAKKVILETIDTAVDSLSEDELQQAKEILINSRVDNFASNSSMAATFISMDRYNLGDDYFDKRVASLKKITLDQVKKAAHKVLNKNRMITLQIGRV